MKRVLSGYLRPTICLCVTVLFLFAVASGNTSQSIVTYNMNSTKSIQAVHIAGKYNSILESQKPVAPVLYPTFGEAIGNASTSEVSFMGKLTGYGPDCVGCGGGSACPPRQNFKNGNIYYNDTLFGKIRIVAADKRIPCGSIIRINNMKISNEPVIAVVMDRGGSVKSNHIDLLFETEKNMQGFSTQTDIRFDIIRWGW